MYGHDMRHSTRARLTASALLAGVVLTGAGAVALSKDSESAPSMPARAAATQTPELSLSDRISISEPDQAGLEYWIPEKFRELLRGSDAVVVGEVTSVGPGEPLLGAEEPDPHLQIPTERAIVQVDSVVTTAPGIDTPPSPLEIYATTPPAPAGEDPAYTGTGLVAGHRYVLFLRESNQFDGRYWLSSAGTFLPIADGQVIAGGPVGMVVSSLAGKSVKEATQEITGAEAEIPRDAFGGASPNPQIAQRAEIRAAFERGAGQP